MKKLLIIAVVLTLCATVFAEENGLFRDIPWGISKLDTIERIESDPSVRERRQLGNLNVGEYERGGGVQWTTVIFDTPTIINVRFFDDQFYDAEYRVKSLKVRDRILAAMIERYGEVMSRSGDYHVWRYDDSVILVSTVDSIDQVWISYTSIELFNQSNAVQDKRTAVQVQEDAKFF